jgi:hypothetical protein
LMGRPVDEVNLSRPQGCGAGYTFLYDAVFKAIQVWESCLEVVGVALQHNTRVLFLGDKTKGACAGGVAEHILSPGCFRGRRDDEQSRAIHGQGR